MMQYRRFGKSEWPVSALGFGCMRLPTVDGGPMSPNINEAEATRMLRQAIDQGVNYVDTAYPYHGGQSEVCVGNALQDGYRSKVKLATKSPVWLIKSAADFDKYLNEQLTKLRTDHIDFYLLHALGHERWNDVVLRYDLLERAEAAIRDGRIGQLGFSFHDGYAAFPEIVDGYDKWAFCQIQYNYMDIQNQAGLKGLQYAAAKGLAVVIMEPLLGGRLANPPQVVKELFKTASQQRTAAEWALQWLWNQPEVSVILSGMSTLEQVDANLVAADRSGIGTLSDADLALIDQVRQRYQERIKVPCTQCSYCMPCPNGVDIPRNFSLYNDGFIYDDFPSVQGTYNRFMGEQERAGSCVGCRICEEKCPQQIPISELLPQAHSLLGQS